MLCTTKIVYYQERLCTPYPRCSSVMVMSNQTQPNGQTRPDSQAQTKRLGDRHSIPGAAKALGISEEAVRGRIKRGSLDSMKVDGQVFVLLTPDQAQPDATGRSQAPGRPDD